jgi:hypothetical protein
MRKIALLMKIINWLIVVVLSLFALSFIFHYEPAQEAFTWIVNVEQQLLGVIVIVVSCLLIFLNLIGLLGIGRKRYLKYLKFNNPKGTVMVSTSALQESLTRTLLQHPQVHDSKVAVLVSPGRNKPIRVLASATIWEGADIVGTQSKIQEMLEKKFKDILKIEEKVVYDIRLERFRFEKGGAKPGPDKPIDLVEDEQAHFTGIRYPIEEDEEN